MNYWLVKSEPFKYSWAQFLEDKRTFWDGVRNYAARNHMRAMKNGDMVLFYHSNEGKEIVGCAKVVKEAYSDPTFEGDTWSVVDIEPVESFEKTITLQEVKANDKLKNMWLVKMGRLSVMPVEKKEYDLIIKLSKG